MGGITGDFVARLAAVWHRFTLLKSDGESLAEMLAPMDAAGERVASQVDFDMEPSDFEGSLSRLAPKRGEK